MAMLALAVASGCRAKALYVDHGLRHSGPEEGEIVKAGARHLGAAFQAAAVRVEPGGDLEARARRARYGALPEGALVGHTADDQAETLLLNIIRGAGLDGLSGMRAADGGPRRVRRPILTLRRRETRAFVDALGLEIVNDPSNFELRFRRNRVRHEVLPLLADVAGRDPVPLLARTAALLGEDADFLDLLAGALDPTDARALADAPPSAGEEGVAPMAAPRGRARAPPAVVSGAPEGMGGGNWRDHRVRAGRRPASQPFFGPSPDRGELHWPGPQRGARGEARGEAR